jgi:6-pyruvoyltetrahydropterin/6-carboxytetrahydropterin synthase
MTERFSVRLRKESLVFSAAHFITFAGNICERLHGHNYGVEVEVTGMLDENHYVVDFVALRDRLQEMVSRLDHHVLLPTEHAQIKVRVEGAEVTATFEDRRWVFPLEDCILLPVANTTAELLAAYLGRELWSWLRQHSGSRIVGLRVAVDENHGQWGEWVISSDKDSRRS